MPVFCCSTFFLSKLAPISIALKLAVVITHPVRYFIPLVQLLNGHNGITIKLFFTRGQALLRNTGHNAATHSSAVPALDIYKGYEAAFPANTAKKSSTGFNSIRNPSLITDITQWQPDAILVNGWNFHSHLQVMRHFKGKIPVYFRGDSNFATAPPSSFLKKLVRKAWLRWVYSHIDAAWYVGIHNKDYFLQCGVAESQLKYVPHCVDNNHFKRTPLLRLEALMQRRKMGIADNDLVILYAGKLVKAKGVFTLLNAFQQSNASPHVHLLFAGQGSDAAVLKDKAGAGNIHFLPHQSQTNMPLIYAMGDVLAMPTEHDTWGLVVNEAMAAGLPVIASTMCGVAADLVDDGVNGCIVPSGDVGVLAAKINQLVTDRGLRERMAAMSLEKIKHFELKHAANFIATILLKQEA